MALESSARVAVSNAIENKQDLGEMLGMLLLCLPHSPILLYIGEHAMMCMWKACDSSKTLTSTTYTTSMKAVTCAQR